MNKLTTQDVFSAEEYEKKRGKIRERIIPLKKRRRIAVGDLVTLIFENRETVLFQVQEMIRTERIVSSEKIQEELDVYNALLPETGELSATLFIEITDSEKIQKILDSLLDIDRPDTVALTVGEEKVFGVFEAGHSKEDKISAVHFLRFPTTPAFRAHLTHPRLPAFVTITHPAYRAEALVSDAMREEWLKDLHP